jgi:uncharacterized protein YbaP (TraB family)
MSRFWTSLAGACAALLFAGAAAAEPPVWIVKDKNSEVVLFGSIHVLPPGLDWAPPVLDRALRNADDIWFELPIDPATEALTGKLATQVGMQPPEGSLYKMMSAADGALLSKVAAANDVSPALLDRLQPWLAEIALAGGAYRKVGADSANGVEATVGALATPKAKRKAFETPQEQITLLSGGSIDEQLASLRETMHELDEQPDEFTALVHAWVNGNVQALDREALAPIRKSSPALFQRMVQDRNARWTEILDARLKGRGKTVVVVGIGHLIGPGGVPARLRALGYSVTGP